MSQPRTTRAEAARALAGLTLAVSLTVGCGPTRTRWRPQPVPVGGATGPPRTSSAQLTEAIVWSGARFLVSPREGAAAVSLAPSARALEPWLRDTLLSVQVVERRGHFIAIETAGDPARCSGRRLTSTSGALRLRLYVPETALAQVTTREITRRFEDGTELTLRRGVPVEPLGRDRLYRVRPGALSLVVRLDPGDVGTRFLPSERPESAPLSQGSLSQGSLSQGSLSQGSLSQGSLSQGSLSQGSLSQGSLSQGSLSADQLRAGAPSLGAGAVQSSVDAAIAVWSATPRGASALVQLRPACAALTVRIPGDAIGPPLPEPRPAPAVAPRAPYVTSGAPAAWRGGTPAGVVTSPLNLDEEREEDGDARCFIHRFSEAATPLELCFPRSRIVDPHPRARALSRPKTS